MRVSRGFNRDTPQGAPEGWVLVLYFLGEWLEDDAQTLQLTKPFPDYPLPQKAYRREEDQW